jgi:hypothetical protein
LAAGADWSVTDLAEMADEAAPKPGKRGPCKKQRPDILKVLEDRETAD